MLDNSCDLNRLPLGLLSFSNLREKNKVYVDKTKLIYEFACKDIPFFFSRPRRFGKSLLINTLSCLFGQGVDYFRGLAIEKLWHDTTYKVIHLDFSEMSNCGAKDFNILLSMAIVDEFNVDYTKYDNSQKLNYPNVILSEILRNTENSSLVLLIDEYDSPLVHHLSQQRVLNHLSDTLNNFYATIKKYTDKFRFIFITGVTRSSHISIFSAFNNLIDLSFRPEFNSLLGFTTNDLKNYFSDYIAVSVKVVETILPFERVCGLRRDIPVNRGF